MIARKLGNMEGFSIDNFTIMATITILKILYLATGLFSACVVATFPELE